MLRNISKNESIIYFKPVNIQKTNLPQNSILASDNTFKFIDGYTSNFTDSNNAIDIQKIGQLFFSTGPKWIDTLFAFRNNTVKWFGLKKTDNLTNKKQLENFTGEPDERIGLFKVNEQNLKAIQFYKKYGFETFERTDKDDQCRQI